MRAGWLRHRLALQTPTEVRGSSGGVTKTFATDSTVWGGIEPLRGKEYLAIGQTQNEATVRITIRYHATIKDTWRVLDTGNSPQTKYTIHSIINENERDRMMILMCSQGVQTQ